MKLVGKIIGMVKEAELDENTFKEVGKLNQKLALCATHSLYSRHLDGNALEYKGSHTCDSKLCYVCNFLGKKRVRRKYSAFFKANKLVNLVRTVSTGRVRALTDNGMKKLESKHKEAFDFKYDVVDKVAYDLMHLTLTLPHSVDGFRGEKYYYGELISAFNKLRKDNETWHKLVYGGEYGVETAGKDNGLHIHLHALLLVAKEKQSRNMLHKHILERWNRLTVDPSSKRVEISDKAKEKIVKGNSLLKQDPEFVDGLNPKGATMITLESVFNYNSKGKKKRAKSGARDDKAMMKAIMECISYHFEPQCFSKKDGDIDVETLIDVLVHIKGQRLYNRFGCLRDEPSLNLKASKTEQVEEQLEDNGEEVLHPVTLKPASRDEYELICTTPLNVFHDSEKDLKPFLRRNATVAYLDSPTLKEAFTEMICKALHLPDSSGGVRVFDQQLLKHFNTDPLPPKPEFVGISLNEAIRRYEVKLKHGSRDQAWDKYGSRHLKEFKEIGNWGMNLDFDIQKPRQAG